MARRLTQRQRFYPVLLGAFLTFLISGSFPAAAQEAAPTTTEAQDAGGLKSCVHRGLGVKFLCDPSWQIKDLTDSVIIVISEKPLVSMVISKIDSKIVYLGQLNKIVLDKMGIYEQGFRTENTRLSNREALKVKAFSKIYEDRRLLDYFFIHDASLYGIMFSVHPQSLWEDQKGLINEIVESVELSDTPSTG